MSALKLKKIMVFLLIIGIWTLFGAVATSQAGGCTQDKNGQTVCTLEDPMPKSGTDVNAVLGLVLKAALGLTGALSLYAFVQGGVTWLRSFGNPEKINKGMHSMLWAILGMLVVFLSYGLSRWVFKILVTGKAWG